MLNQVQAWESGKDDPSVSGGGVDLNLTDPREIMTRTVESPNKYTQRKLLPPTSLHPLVHALCTYSIIS